MSLSKITDNVENIQALSNTPNQTEGLTPLAIKTLFDKGSVDIKNYINNTLVPEIDEKITEFENNETDVENKLAIHKTSNDHDSRYYTETEIDAKLALKSDSTHNHDSVYYTEAEINAKINMSSGALASVDGVSNAKGNIDLVAGEGIRITPNNTNKTITLEATGTSVPQSHGYTHAIDGTDPIPNLWTFETAVGTTTAITLTLPTLVNGFSKTFIASADNNGAPTTINSKPLYKPNTTEAPVLVSGKAYTVWYNSTSDCFFIKASGGGEVKFSNIIKFGNMTDATAWAPNASSNAINNNILTNTGNGTYYAPQIQQQLSLNIYAGKKIYVRATVKATNTYCQRISLYTNDGTNNIVAQAIDNPVQGQEYVLSGVCTQLYSSNVLYLFIRHGYIDANTANGKSIEISKVMVSEFTEIFGVGNEITKSEADAVVNKFGGWWDCDLQLLTADATAATSHILSPYKAYTNGLIKVGTIPSKNAATYNPSTTAQTISSGQYLSGAQTISAVTGTATADKVDSGYTFSSASGINLIGTSTKKKWKSEIINSINVTTFTASNLGFTPSFIIIRCMTTVSSNAYEIVSEYCSGIYQNIATYSRINTETYAPEGAYGSYSAKIPIWTIGSGTFSFSVSGYTFTDVKYWAFE